VLRSVGCLGATRKIQKEAGHPHLQRGHDKVPGDVLCAHERRHGRPEAQARGRQRQGAAASFPPILALAERSPAHYVLQGKADKRDKSAAGGKK
jgi:hypothetical protein